MLSWIFGGTHVFVGGRELALFYPVLSWQLYSATLVLLISLALEPYVRRLWPETLISWSRLLSGRFRDPRVGRDLLIGSTVGVFWPVINGLTVPVANWLGAPVELWRMTEPRTLLGAQHLAAQFFYEPQHCVLMGLYFLFMLLGLRYFTRNQWLAGALFILINTPLNGLGSHSYLVWLNLALIWLSCVCVVTRFGLLAFVATAVTYRLTTTFPITADFSAWYAGGSLFSLIIVAALGVYGFYISLAGQRLFGDVLQRSRL